MYSLKDLVTGKSPFFATLVVVDMIKKTKGSRYDN
jgi:hypothetical protein